MEREMGRGHTLEKIARNERKELESETLSGVNEWAKEKRKEKKSVGPFSSLETERGLPKILSYSRISGGGSLG